MKKLLLIALKIGISLGILGLLVRQSWQNQAIANLWEQPKDWPLLVLAAVLCSSAVLTTMVRWHYLVVALGIPFRLKDALRLGFVGYLFNLAPMGIVGGDILKAVMLAWEHKGYRTKAMASVVVDRIVGLYLLFVVASAAVLLTGFWRLPSPEIQTVCKLTWLITLVGGVGIAILLTPAATDGRVAKALCRMPKIGAGFEQAADAVRMYRRKPRVLLGASLMSVGVHCLFATGVYFVARGLPGGYHCLADHYVIMPLSAVTGVLPLPFGPFELVLKMLYDAVPAPQGMTIVASQGLLVALGYRLITLLVAAVGIVYYLTSRREVAEVIHEVEYEHEIEELVARNTQRHDRANSTAVPG